jgi:aspartate aminotransferase-like enzyme
MAEMNFLPGPVQVSKLVRDAMGAKAIPHRSDAFKRMHAETCRMLQRHGKSKHAALLMGSGTAANAVLAQELKKLSAKGLILSNGEFGSRLIRQATKAGLDFDVYAADWGQPFDYERTLHHLRDKVWLWLVHCETSTGEINFNARLFEHCGNANIKICLDSVSAVGNMETDFSGVYLASCASGKGLRAFPGIAVLFYNHEPEPAREGYEYLDLAAYHAADGVPFTFSSNLLHALHTALSSTNYAEKYAMNAAHAKSIGKLLITTGQKTPVTGQQADYVWTIALDRERDSARLGNALERRHVFLHYRNRYLLERNWIQLALMGEHASREVTDCLQILEEELTVKR